MRSTVADNVVMISTILSAAVSEKSRINPLCKYNVRKKVNFKKTALKGTAKPETTNGWTAQHKAYETHVGEPCKMY
jgi:hypothetical protein